MDDFASLTNATLTPTRAEWDDPAPPEVRIATTRGECVARLHWMGGSPVPWLRCATHDGFPRFDFRVVAGLPPNLPQGTWSEYASRLLLELDGARVRSEAGELSLSWGTTPAPGTLLTGAKLLTELLGSVGRTGPFR